MMTRWGNRPWLRRALADLYLAVRAPVPAHLLPPTDQTWRRYEQEKDESETVPNIDGPRP
jgi:hypothetical protein